MQGLLELALGPDTLKAEHALHCLQKACSGPSREEMTNAEAGAKLSCQLSSLTGNLSNEMAGLSRTISTLRLMRNLWSPTTLAFLRQVGMAAKIAGQLLANLATSTVGAAALWHDLFPTRLLAMLHVSATDVQGPACMVLLSCLRLVPGAAADLCQRSPGPAILQQLALILQEHHASDRAVGDAGETTEMLWGRICLQQGLLGPLLRALCKPQVSAGAPLSVKCLGPMHALTLLVLAEEAQSPTADRNTTKEAAVAIAPERFGSDMTEVLMALARPAPDQQQPAGVDHSSAVLQAALQLARASSAQEDLQQHSNLLGLPERKALLHLMLDMLRALPPIQQQTGAAAAIQQSAHGIPPAMPLEALGPAANGHAGHGSASDLPGAASALDPPPPVLQESHPTAVERHASSDPARMSTPHRHLPATCQQHQLDELAHEDVSRQPAASGMSDAAAPAAPPSMSGHVAAHGDMPHLCEEVSSLAAIHSTPANNDNKLPRPARGESMETGQHQGQGQAADLSAAVMASTSAEPSSSFHRKAPYAGYRSDLVAVIANLVYNQRSLQDAVKASEGVELLLSQCQIDSESPLVREWALWAIRNLCEGNLEIQRHIESLQLQGAAPHQDLNRLGFKVQMEGKQPALRPAKP
ncbi:hypothetical protein WJX74_011016 [Apatococcus lobatus]|uniref:Ataxin-10 domain-containing protein n=1 Tax=Apatococcus lobatus TaxID=904363 RepID=A0AAW1QL02_9CHLO